MCANDYFNTKGLTSYSKNKLCSFLLTGKVGCDQVYALCWSVQELAGHERVL